MLIRAMVTIQRSYVSSHRYMRAIRSNDPTLRSCLLIKKVSENYILSVKNTMFPKCVNFIITDIEQLITENYAFIKLLLLFKEPLRQMTIECDNLETLMKLTQVIQDIRDGKEVILEPMEMPEIDRTDFVAVGFFDLRILDMKNLSKLVLEKCVLSKLPVDVGNLPIEYLSLSDSKLPLSKNDRNTFWAWMSEDTICNTLVTLKMDSIGLETLPFEIMFLRKLKTLSVAKNKLTYLPPYVGEISSLVHINVAGNFLCYLPDSSFRRLDFEFDISNNLSLESESLCFDHIQNYDKKVHTQYNRRIVDREINIVPSLKNLSLNSLINNRIKFKRQDIPNSLWDSFDVMCRCALCSNFILPDFALVFHMNNSEVVHNFRTAYIKCLPNQMVMCRFRCFNNRVRFQLINCRYFL